MTRIPMSEGRERLAEVVEMAQTEAVVLERYGSPAAVLISAARYEELMEAFEEAEDIAAFDSAMADDSPNIPWEQVQKELGWT